MDKDWMEILEEAACFSSRDVANTIFDCHVTLERFSRNLETIESAFFLLYKKDKFVT